MIEIPESVKSSEREQFRDVAEKLLSRKLKRISWRTCRYQTGIVLYEPTADPDDFEKAAAELKALGCDWEEYC